MTALTLTARLDAVTALFAGPFVAGLLLLLIFAVAWVARAERLRRERSNRYLTPWVRADRTPGEIR